LADRPRKGAGAAPAFALLDVGLLLFLAAALFRNDAVRQLGAQGLRFIGL
jgi:hypothetical protein